MYKKNSLEKGILLPYQMSSRRTRSGKTGAKLKKCSPIMKRNEEKLEKLLFLSSEFGDKNKKNYYKL